MFLKRGISYLLIAILFNIVLFLHIFPDIPLLILAATGLVGYYFYYHICPLKYKPAKRRLRILSGGYELMLASMVCSFIEFLIYGCIIISDQPVPLLILLINGLMAWFLAFLLLFHGLVRIFFCSSQLGIMARLALLLFWWVPGINLFLLRKFMTVSRTEYRFTENRKKMLAQRKEDMVCGTKYPILMVHGIFFRDWKSFNYWGRIPKELEDNGAVIYYSNHQSSASVEQCANEIKQRILSIVQETGCQKVNIIAHSKGGLDSRYAISCLGMDQYAASLTTINTPHMGCNYVCRILDRIPQKTVAAIGNKYDALYRKLGDDNPDFFSGLKDLTDRECSRLNKIMKNVPGVLYQSTGSRMVSHTSAMFPLSLGYCIIKFFGGRDNDGLVSISSMEWGEFLGIISSKSRQGISHGDMIDLTRKNIEGFDVCEFYIDLVSQLKSKGL